MKYLYIGIVVLHGLIHVMGFTKAFGLASVPQLRTAIALPLGVLWLVAALLFLASAALFFVLPNRWWLAALAAVAVSQVLIITAWSDAKVGTVANLIVLVPALLAALSYTPWGFKNAATTITAVTAARHTNAHPD